MWKIVSDSRRHRESREFSAPGVFFSGPSSGGRSCHKQSDGPQAEREGFSNSRVAKSSVFWSENLSILKTHRKMLIVEKC